MSIYYCDEKDLGKLYLVKRDAAKFSSGEVNIVKESELKYEINRDVSIYEIDLTVLKKVKIELNKSYV